MIWCFLRSSLNLEFSRLFCSATLWRHIDVQAEAVPQCWISRSTVPIHGIDPILDHQECHSAMLVAPQCSGTRDQASQRHFSAKKKKAFLVVFLCTTYLIFQSRLIETIDIAKVISIVQIYLFYNIKMNMFIVYMENNRPKGRLFLGQTIGIFAVINM